MFQYVSFLPVSRGFHESLFWIGQGEEVRMTLSEPNFATKLAATCAVDAESFPEALIFYFKNGKTSNNSCGCIDFRWSDESDIPFKVLKRLKL